MTSPSSKLISTVQRFFPDADPREKANWVLEWCAQQECRIVEVSPKNLPRLIESPQPPALLFVKGNAEILSQTSLAMVGTRQPSHYGIRAALSFANGLAQLGWVVVSGLARGIDSAAHQGALRANGFTVAVVGHGLDRIYPAANLGLSREILASGGAIVSEYPPGVPPLRHHFPARNRIISGLAVGTLVVQAAEKSGSLITARHALEQNREVFIVPGLFDDVTFTGGLRLIQEGAKLITKVEDILNEFSSERLPCGVKTSEPEFVSLRDFFLANDRTASLASLSHAGQSLHDLTAAVQHGCVVEISPQTFAWIAP